MVMPEVIRETLPRSRFVSLLDWDNTLREGFTVLEWSTFLASNGLAPSSYPSQIRRALYDYRSGSLTYSAFAEAAECIFLANEPDLTANVAQTLSLEFLNSNTDSLKPWTEELIEELNTLQWTPVIVSGAPLLPLRAFAQYLNVKFCFGWAVESTPNGRRLRWGNTAQAAVKTAIATEAATNSQVRFALGDSDQDEPLLSSAIYAGLVKGDRIVAWKSGAGNPLVTLTKYLDDA